MYWLAQASKKLEEVVPANHMEIMRQHEVASVTTCTYHKKPPAHHESYWVEKMLRSGPGMNAAEECKLVCDDMKVANITDPGVAAHHCTRLCTKVLRVMSYRIASLSPTDSIAEEMASDQKKLDAEKAAAPTRFELHDVLANDKHKYKPGWEVKNFKEYQTEQTPSELEKEAERLEIQLKKEKAWLALYRSARQSVKSDGELPPGS